jgi:hypothetical protein
MPVRTTDELTEAGIRYGRYRRQPKRVGTETGNSDSERLHSTDEWGKP